MKSALDRNKSSPSEIELWKKVKAELIVHIQTLWPFIPGYATLFPHYSYAPSQHCASLDVLTAIPASLSTNTTDTPQSEHSLQRLYSINGRG
jgi:hypothetical protein